MRGGGLLPRTPFASATALLAAAEEAAASPLLEDDVRRRILRSFVKAANPDRRRTLSSTLAGSPTDAASSPRRHLRDASCDELLAAVRLDTADARRAEDEYASLPPYKKAERRFRLPPRTLTSNSGWLPSWPLVDDEGSAVAAGAFDFGSSATWRSDATTRLRLGIRLIGASSSGGCGAEVLAVDRAPGCYILPAFLSRDEQAYWVRMSLRRYAERPNRRNIDSRLDPDVSNVGLSPAPSVDSPYYNAPNTSKDCEVSDSDGTRTDSITASGCSVSAALASRFETNIWQRHVQSCALSSIVAANTARPLGTSAATTTATTASGGCRCPLRRLTWATLGQQYDWTARSYHLPGDADYATHARRVGVVSDSENLTGDCNTRWSAAFPEELQVLAADIANAAHAAVSHPIDEVPTASSEWPWTSVPSRVTPPADSRGLPLAPLRGQAGIVNFYQAVDEAGRLPMGGHRDDMERSAAYPVVSLSLGCTAVFLIEAADGGEPLPLILRSGDVVLLSGASRLALHGVPQVFSDTTPAGLFADGGASVARAPNLERLGGRCGHTSAADVGGDVGLPGCPEEEVRFVDFMRNARININVRQVVA